MDDLIKLATAVGAALEKKNWLMATAESCTGGGIASAITEIAGSSTWFDCGFVTYSNTAKVRLLSVAQSALDQHGAVSEAVAASMAEGAVNNSQATVAVSTTGIAGPGGGTRDKPVGTVCFGWRVAGHTLTERYVFEGDRHAVREQTVAHALARLLALIEKSN